MTWPATLGKDLRIILLAGRHGCRIMLLTLLYLCREYHTLADICTYIRQSATSKTMSWLTFSLHLESGAVPVAVGAVLLTCTRCASFNLSSVATKAGSVTRYWQRIAQNPGRSQQPYLA